MPVAFASRYLKGSERRYNIMDKEGLAIILEIKNFKSYIFDIYFKIFINYNNIKALHNKAILKGKLAK